MSDIDALHRRAAELTPSDEEKPFYDCLAGIRDLSVIGSRDFRAVSRGYKAYRAALEESFALVKRNPNPEREALAKIREAWKQRQIARVRATGLLVLADALIDNLLVRLYKERTKKAFGPHVKGRRFTQVLQAAANASRHGHEWFDRLISALETDFPETDAAALRAFMMRHLDGQQHKSLDAIVAVTALEPWGGSYDGPAAALIALGDDHFGGFFDRFCASVIDVAERTKRRLHLDYALVRLNVPERVITKWETVLDGP